MKPSWKLGGIAAGFLWIAIVAGVVYAGMYSSPYLADAAIVPEWVGKIVDSYPIARHFTAFFVLNALGLIVRGKDDDCRSHFKVVAFSFALAACIELMQLMLPRRNADLVDIGAGCLGVLAAWGGSAGGRRTAHPGGPVQSGRCGSGPFSAWLLRLLFPPAVGPYLLRESDRL